MKITRSASGRRSKGIQMLPMSGDFSTGSFLPEAMATPMATMRFGRCEHPIASPLMVRFPPGMKLSIAQGQARCNMPGHCWSRGHF